MVKYTPEMIKFILELRDTGETYKNIAKAFNDVYGIKKTPDAMRKVCYAYEDAEIDEEVLGMSTLELRRKLLEKGIETRFRYESPLNMQEILLQKNAYPLGCPFSCPFYGKTIDYASFKYPNAEKVMGKMLGLPNHLKLKKQDLDVIISCLQEV